MNPEEVIGYFKTLSNWGRWGDDDRLGTLNLITPEGRRRAAALVQTGEVISLSRDIDPENPDPLGSGIAVVQRFMGIGEVSHHVGKGASRFCPGAHRQPNPARHRRQRRLCKRLADNMIRDSSQADGHQLSKLHGPGQKTTCAFRPARSLC